MLRRRQWQRSELLGQDLFMLGVNDLQRVFAVVVSQKIEEVYVGHLRQKKVSSTVRGAARDKPVTRRTSTSATRSPWKAGIGCEAPGLGRQSLLVPVYTTTTTAVSTTMATNEQLVWQAFPPLKPTCITIFTSTSTIGTSISS
ncbi:hypothetical protein C4D60_Mb04t02600 [Musa balbisiana]|uniref:Uncharacterized protein n=1 Tax=Musa balbisiana TaxID=52838 RepID=A0A4S8K988_MUSBA|nr:hypothetical protein C4D60_Mb04t02600 [Musa balbisiana]